MLNFFFFFSSRRRHTRWNCDWSSDVCSSDLVGAPEGRAHTGLPDPHAAAGGACPPALRELRPPPSRVGPPPPPGRRGDAGNLPEASATDRGTGVPGVRGASHLDRKSVV